MGDTDDADAEHAHVFSGTRQAKCIRLGLQKKGYLAVTTIPLESSLCTGQEHLTFIREGYATVSPSLGLQLGLGPGPEVDKRADNRADPQAHQEAALGPFKRDHNSPTPCNIDIWVTNAEGSRLPN